MANPDATDPDRTGSSLRNLVDVVFPCLDAVGARSVIEIGASHGDFTSELLDWATASGARVTAVEPAPAAELLELAERRPELELVRETSQEALRRLTPRDAIVIDGDHNHYTVSEDLKLIFERAPGERMPLVLLHDVGWPHGRRDAYYAPDRIPESRRQPLAHNAHLDPEVKGVADGGFHVEWTAEREGSPGNGVLTAIEDFMAERPGLRLAVVPPFFGLGVLWHPDAGWAEALAAVVEPWDRNPLLERLEANRCLKLAEWARAVQKTAAVQEELRVTAEQLAHEREVRARQEEVLRAMLDSSAFAWGERLSRVRQRGQPTFSREQVRRVLGEEDPG
jgi:predicted O-methyltransferase YrrM